MASWQHDRSFTKRQRFERIIDLFQNHRSPEEACAIARSVVRHIRRLHYDVCDEAFLARQAVIALGGGLQRTLQQSDDGAWKELLSLSTPRDSEEHDEETTHVGDNDDDGRWAEGGEGSGGGGGGGGSGRRYEEQRGEGSGGPTFNVGPPLKKGDKALRKAWTAWATAAQLLGLRRCLACGFDPPPDTGAAGLKWYESLRAAARACQTWECMLRRANHVLLHRIRNEQQRRLPGPRPPTYAGPTCRFVQRDLLDLRNWETLSSEHGWPDAPLTLAQLRDTGCNFDANGLVTWPLTPLSPVSVKRGVATASSNAASGAVKRLKLNPPPLFQLPTPNHSPSKSRDDHGRESHTASGIQDNNTRDGSQTTEEFDLETSHHVGEHDLCDGDELEQALRRELEKAAFNGGSNFENARETSQELPGCYQQDRRDSQSQEEQAREGRGQDVQDAMEEEEEENQDLEAAEDEDVEDNDDDDDEDNNENDDIEQGDEQGDDEDEEAEGNNGDERVDPLTSASLPADADFDQDPIDFQLWRAKVVSSFEHLALQDPQGEEHYDLAVHWLKVARPAEFAFLAQESNVESDLSRDIANVDAIQVRPNDLLQLLDCGYVFTKPIVIRREDSRFSDSSIDFAKQHLRFLRDAYVEVDSQQTSLRADPRPMRIEDFAAQIEPELRYRNRGDSYQVNRAPSNLLNLGQIGQSQNPGFLSHPRLDLLSLLGARATGGPGKHATPSRATDSFKRNEFNLFATALSFSAPHVDVLSGTWVRILSGAKAWLIADSTPEHLPEFEQHAGQWRPASGTVYCILLRKHDVLIMPPGVPIIHAPVTILPCLIHGGAVWDRQQILSTLHHVRWTAMQPAVTNEPVPLQLRQMLDALRAIVSRDYTPFQDGLPDFPTRFAQAIARLTEVGCSCSANPCPRDRCPCLRRGSRCTELCQGPRKRRHKINAKMTCCKELGA